MRWNVKTWTLVTAPAGASLRGVAVVSAHQAWTVGARDAKTFIARWNGKTWKQVKAPTPKGPSGAVLSSVAATSARNAWAVGAGEFNADALIIHWNGSVWKHPGPGYGGQLTTVAPPYLR